MTYPRPDNFRTPRPAAASETIQGLVALFSKRRQAAALQITLFALAALLAACSRVPDVSLHKIQPGDYTLSQRCGECHKDIHAGWASSVHASAAMDALFRQAFEEAAAV